MLQKDRILSYIEKESLRSYDDLFKNINFDNYKQTNLRKFLQDNFKKEEIIEDKELIRILFFYINSKITSYENLFYLHKLISRCKHDLIYYTFLYCARLMRFHSFRTVNDTDNSNPYFEGYGHFLGNVVGAFVKDKEEGVIEIHPPKLKWNLKFINLKNWIEILQNTKLGNVRNYFIFYPQFYKLEGIAGFEKIKEIKINKERFYNTNDFCDLSTLNYIDKIYHYRLLDNYCCVANDINSTKIFNDDLYSAENKKKFKNQIRKEFGYKNVGEQWIRETKLYYSIKNIMDKLNVEVIQHHYPEFLKGQHYDIYFEFKGKKIAVEHQGQQHFTSIEHFGGQKALLNTIKNDRKKKIRSTRNKVKLLYFDYKEPLEKNYIIDKLNNKLDFRISI